MCRARDDAKTFVLTYSASHLIRTMKLIVKYFCNIRYDAEMSFSPFASLRFPDPLPGLLSWRELFSHCLVGVSWLSLPVMFENACHSLQGIGSPCPSPMPGFCGCVSLPAVFPAGSGNPQLRPVPPSPHLAPPCWVVGHLSCDVDTSLLGDHVVCDVRERAAVSMLWPLIRPAGLGCMTPHPGCTQ